MPPKLFIIITHYRNTVRAYMLYYKVEKYDAQTYVREVVKATGKTETLSTQTTFVAQS